MPQVYLASSDELATRVVAFDLDPLFAVDLNRGLHLLLPGQNLENSIENGVDVGISFGRALHKGGR